MKKSLKIEFTPQDEIERRRTQIDKLLFILGHSEAWVSNESWLGDFAVDAEEQAEAFERIFQAYGVVITIEWLQRPLYKLVDFLERPKTYGLEN
jgi:hypothetical protein